MSRASPPPQPGGLSAWLTRPRSGCVLATRTHAEMLSSAYGDVRREKWATRWLACLLACALACLQDLVAICHRGTLVVVAALSLLLALLSKQTSRSDPTAPRLTDVRWWVQSWTPPKSPEFRTAAALPADRWCAAPPLAAPAPVTCRAPPRHSRRC